MFASQGDAHVRTGAQIKIPVLSPAHPNAMSQNLANNIPTKT